jgi:hypoxanthine phosphoribosyltransferase
MTLQELITDLKAAGANDNTLHLALNCYELGKADANEAANRSWTMMCKKMVEDEREACAKECEHTAQRMGSEWMAQHCAAAIRARGQHDIA